MVNLMDTGHKPLLMGIFMSVDTKIMNQADKEHTLIVLLVNGQAINTLASIRTEKETDKA